MALPRLNEKQIKEDPEQQLKNFKRTKDFLVAIDTDGCVTDNMNGKQMLIFHPQFMEFYQLREICSTSFTGRGYKITRHKTFK